MNLYEEFQAARDARLLAQTPMPIYADQRRKGLRRRIAVTDVHPDSVLSKATVARIESGELQVEHRFKPQEKPKRYPRSKQELVLQFRQHGRST